ncbi:SDR family NAD(P)-dependent oxidoreductase [Novosphingobium resinovorum]|uniref:SDR family NAD(P)-dependent oxidoreductase n=1 Tax=Sphingomonadaceae TaxID=41297 RepID=UPI00027CA407|nr:MULTISPECIES: SDR family NAD(P)-dependent oxidoreductase [Sphingomonadaceae]EJU10518.1 short-chain dehydrogenase/reductase SDR [Sphingomonas sp. LH128]MBF7014468.1 SDR family oxidoreductase [Novosphingobium sp. HR1a]WJM25051.1 SDR family NAD(P)-dependent oxidoreductase [Novosphingobium resinovorum]
MTSKTIIVTGAASAGGLGFATARLLARQGHAVTLTDLDGDAAAVRAEELRAEGLTATGLAQDVTDEAGWAALIAQVSGETGRIDGLVNNAGIAVLKWTADLDSAAWDRQIDVNLKSVYLGCRAVLPVMEAQGSGSIVNLSSIAGLVGVAGASAYAASKGGVRLYSKALALEVAAKGIRVNSVHPGVIWTEMQKVAIEDNPDQYDAINAAIPMKRMGEPDDIGEMIAFLISDRAKYVTGGEFVVDGGLTAQ